MIERVEFVGCTVLGPAKGSRASYTNTGANPWGKGWSARIDGASVILEGEGRRIEVPRSLCVVYHVPDAVPIQPAAIADDDAAQLAAQLAANAAVEPLARGKAGRK